MKALKWILIVLAVLVLILLAFLAYMGVFSAPKATEMKTGPYLLVYEEFTGPYAQTGKVFERVSKAVKAEGFDTPLGIGIYLDDPSKVPQEKMRSRCGVVIDKKDIVKFNRVRYKFKTKRIAEKDSIVVEFPIRNNLSYMIGPMKGYPALMKHAQAKGYQMAQPIELYDMPKGKILFIMEIVK